jgi:hypothetical protein
MIKPSNYRVPISIIERALETPLEGGVRVTINQPSGNFFYDDWVLKKEYIGTAWETIYNSLPTSKGEARVITLNAGTCYQSHADIDDRWHLNIRSESAYLIDLSNKVLHEVQQDGIWYDMDAGILHTAANFGRVDRLQLVVRKLLVNNHISNPADVIISVGGSSPDDSRYVFDHVISPWLNFANKQGVITNFRYVNSNIHFTIDQNAVNELSDLINTTDFKLKVT